MIPFARTVSLAKRGINNFFAKRPFCVSFEVTYSCNARCKHCHLGGAVDEVRAAPQKYAELCREVRPVVAQISGGEPLLRKDLEQIISAIKIPNRAPYIVVTTNGTLLTKERYTSLQEAGTDEFSLSFDFPDERHDEFRGVPGLFDRISNLMNELKSNENIITLSCVIQRENFRDLIHMAEFARQWNVKMNYSTYTWLRTNKKEYMIPKEEMPEFREVIKQLLAFKRKHKNIFTSDYTFKKMIEFFENHSLPNCRAGERFFVINPNGTFSPCGLIIKKFNSQKDMKRNFLKHNTCEYCFTSIRANSEKSVKYLIKDSLKSI